MRQGLFFDIGGARAFHESKTQQQEALAILRVRKLTKSSFEQDWPGSRLAPAIDKLRNGWGFDILGEGEDGDPYFLVNANQSPTKVATTRRMKELYYETEHWKRTRELRYRHDSYRCVLCVDSCRESLECHHITYNLFAEKLDELMTVCVYHHKLIHEKAKLSFPTGLDLPVAERLLGLVAYPFEEWLLP
jgi:hypothetical protein